ncbi:MAG: hypothetical protein M1821_008427 [Bathelium mastoideum]|nr:MAG: hypothetical protein M1821_008427 [Bathelium mastoideum]
MSPTTSTFSSFADEVYTLCDGNPRAKPAATSPSSTTITETVYQQLGWTETSVVKYTEDVPISGIATSTSLSTIVSNTPIPITTCTRPANVVAPSCTIGLSDWKSLATIYRSFAERECAIQDISTGLFPPPISGWTKTMNPCDHCTIHVAAVKLLYFPVTMGGDLCGNRTTVTPSTPGPTRIEAFGREFTTGSVYISYPGAYALNYGGVQCGARHDSGYLTLPSSSLSSFRSSIVSGRGLTSQYSFNFGDLPPNPVPADAWWGANGQATITDADYAPAIADAIYFRALDPAWSDCAIQTFGVQDPPYALTQEAIAAAPSNVGAQPTAEPQSIVSATPASGISMSAATQTANTATGDEDPKEPQDNTSSSRLSQLPQLTRTGKSAVISDPATHRSSTKDPVDSSGRHVNVSPTVSDEFSSASPPQPDQEQSAAVFSTPAGSVSQLDGQGASVGYPSDTTESRVTRHPQSLPVESSTDDIASLSPALGRMSDDGPALTEVGSTTISMSAGSSKFVSVFGGLAISAGSRGAIVISSATYQVGDVMTLAGAPVSAISHGLVVPSEMASVPTSTSNDAPANLISASIDPGAASQATPASRTGGRFSSSRHSSDVHSARISKNGPYSDASARSRQGGYICVIE